MSDKEMLKEADEWLYSMKCLLSVKTDEEDRAYTQKRIDLFNWLIEQAEQNKRYREAIEFGIEYLKNSDIRQVQLVVTALKNAMEGEE